MEYSFFVPSVETVIVMKGWPKPEKRERSSNVLNVSPITITLNILEKNNEGGSEYGTEVSVVWEKAYK